MPSQLPARRTGRLRYVLLGAVVLIVAYVGFVATQMFLTPQDVQPQAAIGIEERYVRSDGTVDFAAAINDEWSEGVTPENNAVVPLVQAFGPQVIAPEVRSAYFDLLQFRPSSESVAHLVSLGVYLEEQQVDRDRQNELLTLPANAIGNSPEIVDWIDRNKVPLERIVEASRRDRFYAPIVPPTAGPLMNTRIEEIQACREAARLLRARALVRLTSRDIAGACDDAIALHRLGRLVSHHSTIIGFLVGVAIDSIGAEVSQAIVLSNELSPELAVTFRSEIDALPPLADAAKTLDRGERLLWLDAALHCIKGIPGTPVPLPGGLNRGLDPNITFGRFDAFYDEFVEAMRIDDYEARSQRLQALGARLQARSQGSDVSKIALSILFGSRNRLTQHISDVLLMLLFPAVEQVQIAEDRAAMRDRLLRVAAVLGEYRAKNGEFPESLDALQPAFIEQFPEDLFSDDSLHYSRRGDGFLLYSVGPNGVDDGGVSLGESTTGGDDVRFGLPPNEDSSP